MTSGPAKKHASREGEKKSQGGISFVCKLCLAAVKGGGGRGRGKARSRKKISIVRMIFLNTPSECRWVEGKNWGRSGRNTLTDQLDVEGGKSTNKKGKLTTEKGGQADVGIKERGEKKGGSKISFMASVIGKKRQ